MADHERGLGDTDARALSRADNPLVRAVGRAPVTVRTKLLVAFAVIAALLVAVAVLGLRVLGQSNARVESLGTLQRRAGTYQSLQTQAQLRAALGKVSEATDDPLEVIYVGTVAAVRFVIDNQKLYAWWYAGPNPQVASAASSGTPARRPRACQSCSV